MERKMINRRRLLVNFGASAAIAGMAYPSIAQTKPMRLSTGAQGGTFFVYGEAMAKLITSKTGIAVEAVASAGTIENVRRIDNGTAELALAAMGPAYEAWTASAAPWSGSSPLRNMRAIAPMYETPFHLATIEATGIANVRDLDGKQVGVGPKGGANELIFLKLMEGLGIKSILMFGDPNELADRVIKRECDALFFGAGAPIPAYTKIANAAQIRFIPLEGSSAEIMRRAFPYLSINAIPAASYRGQTLPVPTVALWNFMIIRADLTNEQAYSVAKALLSDAAMTRASHPAASATSLLNLSANTFMPFHPGAIQFFTESGIPAASLAR
jgi:uncharacterized protein